MLKDSSYAKCRALTLIPAVALLTLACAGSTGNRDFGRAGEYRVETLVSGGPLHGAKGISFGPDGNLYVCSVYAQSVYSVNVTTGEVTVAVGAPDGESDDVAFAPDGTMAWTALPSAEIRARQPGGEPYVLAKKLPLINPVGYTSDGRMFAAQIGIDRFLEIDVTGKEEPRLVAKGIGHLNSFEITADDQLYGPLAGIGTLARIDLATGILTPVAENLDTLSAVNLNSRGQIFAVGWASGELLRFDADSGEAELITTIDPPIDNLAIDADDMIYVSLPARGAIVRIDPETAKKTEIVPGNMGIPGGLAMTMLDGRETLFVADDFGFRLVDAASGRIWATTDLAEFMDPDAATDIAVDDEVVVLSDVSRSRVYMLNRKTGEKLQKWRRIGTPYGVLLDQGKPIVAEFDGGQIIRLSRTDRKAKEILAEGLNGPVDLVWAGTDSLYVTEALAGNVTRIDLTDGSKRVIASGLSQPEGLTMMRDGRLAVVEAGSGQVTAIDLDNGATTTLANNLPIGAVVPEAPGPVHVPSGIISGSDGTLYLSSDRDHSLLKLIPES